MESVNHIRRKAGDVMMRDIKFGSHGNQVNSTLF